MSEKIITVCDGCETELKEVKESYRLTLKTDRYWDGIENTSHLEELDFCRLCVKDIKETLKKLASK